MTIQDKYVNKVFMVVDDSSMMRRIVRNCLVKNGVDNARILEAGDGEDAFAQLVAGKVDCVLADWNMPNCDGLTFLKRMRALSGYEYTPFIMLSSESSRDSVLEAIRAGVNAYLAKPFAPELLKQRLDEVLV